MILKKIFAIIPAAEATVKKPSLDYCTLHYDTVVQGEDGGDVTYQAGYTMGPGKGYKDENVDWALICVMDSIKWITNLLFNFIMILSVVVILIGAAFYVTAGGRENRLKTAKKILSGAIIGIVIALVAKIVPSVVRSVVGL